MTRREIPFLVDRRGKAAAAALPWDLVAVVVCSVMVVVAEMCLPWVEAAVPCAALMHPTPARCGDVCFHAAVKGQELAFDARSSSDADDDDALHYAFDFGDGHESSVLLCNSTETHCGIAYHTYRSAGIFTARLYVSDMAILIPMPSIDESAASVPISVLRAARTRDGAPLPVTAISVRVRELSPASACYQFRVEAVPVENVNDTSDRDVPGVPLAPHTLPPGSTRDLLITVADPANPSITRSNALTREFAVLGEMPVLYLNNATALSVEEVALQGDGMGIPGGLYAAQYAIVDSSSMKVAPRFWEADVATAGIRSAAWRVRVNVAQSPVQQVGLFVRTARGASVLGCTVAATPLSLVIAEPVRSGAWNATYGTEMQRQATRSRLMLHRQNVSPAPVAWSLDVSLHRCALGHGLALLQSNQSSTALLALTTDVFSTDTILVDIGEIVGYDSLHVYAAVLLSERILLGTSRGLLLSSSLLSSGSTGLANVTFEFVLTGDAAVDGTAFMDDDVEVKLERADACLPVTQEVVRDDVVVIVRSVRDIGSTVMLHSSSLHHNSSDWSRVNVSLSLVAEAFYQKMEAVRSHGSVLEHAETLLGGGDSLATVNITTRSSVAFHVVSASFDALRENMVTLIRVSGLSFVHSCDNRSCLGDAVVMLSWVSTVHSGSRGYVFPAFRNSTDHRLYSSFPGFCGDVHGTASVGHIMASISGNDGCTMWLSSDGGFTFRAAAALADGARVRRLVTSHAQGGFVLESDVGSMYYGRSGARHIVPLLPEAVVSSRLTDGGRSSIGAMAVVPDCFGRVVLISVSDDRILQWLSLNPNDEQQMMLFERKHVTLRNLLEGFIRPIPGRHALALSFLPSQSVAIYAAVLASGGTASAIFADSDQGYRFAAVAAGQKGVFLPFAQLDAVDVARNMAAASRLVDLQGDATAPARHYGLLILARNSSETAMGADIVLNLVGLNTSLGASEEGWLFSDIGKTITFAGRTGSLLLSEFVNVTHARALLVQAPSRPPDIFSEGGVNGSLHVGVDDWEMFDLRGYREYASVGRQVLYLKDAGVGGGEVMAILKNGDDIAGGRMVFDEALHTGMVIALLGGSAACPSLARYVPVSPPEAPGIPNLRLPQHLACSWGIVSTVINASAVLIIPSIASNVTLAPGNQGYTAGEWSLFASERASRITGDTLLSFVALLEVAEPTWQLVEPVCDVSYMSDDIFRGDPMIINLDVDEHASLVSTVSFGGGSGGDKSVLAIDITSPDVLVTVESAVQRVFSSFTLTSGSDALDGGNDYKLLDTDQHQKEQQLVAELDDSAFFAFFGNSGDSTSAALDPAGTMLVTSMKVAGVKKGTAVVRFSTSGVHSGVFSCPFVEQTYIIASACPPTKRIRVKLPASHMRRTLPYNYRPPSKLGRGIPTSDHFYHGNRGAAKYNDWFAESKETGTFKQCPTGGTSELDCSCSEVERASMLVQNSECIRTVMEWYYFDAFLVDLWVDQADAPESQKLQLPVRFVEVNNRTDWCFDHTACSGSTDDRNIDVDPTKHALKWLGDELFHFRIVVASGTHCALETEVLLYIISPPLDEALDNVVVASTAMIIGIALLCSYLAYAFHYGIQKTS